MNNVACINEVRNACKILEGESVREQPLGDQGGDTIMLMLMLGKYAVLLLNNETNFKKEPLLCLQDTFAVHLNQVAIFVTPGM